MEDLLYEGLDGPPQLPSVVELRKDLGAVVRERRALAVGAPGVLRARQHRLAQHQRAGSQERHGISKHCCDARDKRNHGVAGRPHRCGAADSPRAGSDQAGCKHGTVLRSHFP